MHVHKLNNIQEDKTREQASSIDGFIDDMAMIFKYHFYIAKNKTPFVCNRDYGL